MPKSIRAMIDGIPSLGSYSGVMDEIEEVLNDPSSTLGDVGKVIENDPDLTARLLRLGNSSFYGFPSRIDTVAETISLIGIQQVQDLISVSTVVEMFDGLSADMVSMESFWRHSLACGIAARAIALDRRVPKPEKFFVAGLLHDIGRLVIFIRDCDTAKEMFNLAQTKSMLLRDAERQIMGFDHCEIGEALLRAWNYPANLTSAVRYHHHPLAGNAYQVEASIVHFADFIVNGMELGTSGEKFIPPLQLKAWERINFPLESLIPVMEEVDTQIIEVERVFLQSGSATK